MKFNYLTAGESHGPALTGIIEGIPAGLALTAEDIDRDLARRQVGYGRGDRMKIENDRVRILSGVRHGRTLGGPITLIVWNKDWENWTEIMGIEPSDDAGGDGGEKLSIPRPGHADLAGLLKFRHNDIRNVLERASARTTAMTVALGAVARRLLAETGITVAGHVTAIGGIRADKGSDETDPARIEAGIGDSDLLCLDPTAAEGMRTAIDKAKEDGDTLGGSFRLLAAGVPPGLGSFTQPDRRLDGHIAGKIMAIQAIKAVAIGDGFAAVDTPGSEFHDPYISKKGEIGRVSNRAGGIEGGISNGEPITVHGYMKPIPTLVKPLDSVDLASGEPVPAHHERSDVCAVPAATVVAGSVFCLVLVEEMLHKFGGDSVSELLENVGRHREWVDDRLHPGA
ncbi:chorismate synthase [candidate division KSB1 bacterium]